MPRNPILQLPTIQNLDRSKINGIFIGLLENITYQVLQELLSFLQAYHAHLSLLNIATLLNRLSKLKSSNKELFYNSKALIQDLCAITINAAENIIDEKDGLIDPHDYKALRILYNALAKVPIPRQRLSYMANKLLVCEKDSQSIIEVDDISISFKPSEVAKVLNSLPKLEIDLSRHQDLIHMYLAAAKQFAKSGK